MSVITNNCFWEQQELNKSKRLKTKASRVSLEICIDLLVHQVFLLFHSEYTVCTCSCTVRKKQVPFSMAIGNELVQECFPKHSQMGTARMK